MKEGSVLLTGNGVKIREPLQRQIVSPDKKTVMTISYGGPIFSVSMEILEQDLGPRLVYISQADALFLGN